jgi:LysR family hydrogen peroxide-inducible transcriptional activator
MELQNVRYFLTLCEEETFSRAAMRCGIAQPSLTKAIRRLEKHLGGALFVRRPRVQPTPLALALKPHFDQIALSVEIAEQEAKRMLGNKLVTRRSRGRRAA